MTGGKVWGLPKDRMRPISESVNPSDDLIRSVPAAPEAGWSETRWIGGYDPDRSIGFFLHAGRQRDRLDLWWVQMVMYLPDGTLLVDRSWGVSPEGVGLHVGGVTFDIDEPFVSSRLHFEGAGELVTPQELADGPRGSGLPRSFGLDVALTAAGPVWDLGTVLGSDGVDLAAGHTQQAFRLTGSIRHGETVVAVDGVGYADHSHGTRSFSRIGRHSFLLALLPGAVVHSVVMADDNLRPVLSVGVRVDETGSREIASLTMPYLESLTGDPTSFTISATGADGADITFDAEILHAAPVTMTVENDNVNGVEWDHSENPLVLAECVVRLTAPDGAVGYGHLERSGRRDFFDRSTLRTIKTGEKYA